MQAAASSRQISDVVEALEDDKGMITLNIDVANTAAAARYHNFNDVKA